MKVPKSFTPEKESDSKIDTYLTKGLPENQGLAIALAIKEGSYHKGLLYVWEPLMGEPKLVRKRDAVINDLCYSKSKNKFYDCGVYKKIYDALLDKEYISSEVPILAMCDYENHLVYSNLSEINQAHSDLSETYLGRCKVARREGWVEALAVHDEEVCDSGKYGIYKGLEEKEEVSSLFDLHGVLYSYSEEYKAIKALCSHKGDIYGAGSYNIYNVSTKGRITGRNSEICALCSFGKTLLDGGAYGKVMDAYKDKPLLDFKNRKITALETIPIELVKELIKTAE